MRFTSAKATNTSCMARIILDWRSACETWMQVAIIKPSHVAELSCMTGSLLLGCLFSLRACRANSCTKCVCAAPRKVEPGEDKPGHTSRNQNYTRALGSST